MACTITPLDKDSWEPSRRCSFLQANHSTESEVVGYAYQRQAQVLVEYKGRTVCFNYEPSCKALGGVDVRAVLLSVSERFGLPVSLLRLQQANRDLDPEQVVANGSFVHCCLRGGLRGGKGGFGAALRMSGRGGQKTTNFSACRDLNGRRLRHVNNEIRLRKWKQEAAARKKAKENGELFLESSQDQTTASGIEGWHLDVPTWASLGKGSSSKSQRKVKAEICWHWEAARSNGQPVPDGAPAWYGCPKGPQCIFAHGESELSEEGKFKLRQTRQEERFKEQSQVMLAFTKEMQSVQDNMASAVACGLKASMQEKAKENSKQASDYSLIPLECLSGEVGVGATGEVEGRSKFGSASSLGVSLCNGTWMYEVEILSGGVAQIGWGSDLFNPDESDGDGVGDVDQSWGYDGSRRQLWNAGTEVNNFGDSEWKQGDVVGTVLDLDKKRGYFYLNGKQVGTFTVCNQGNSLGYYPVVSLEQGEVVRFNFGSRLWKYRDQYLKSAVGVEQGFHSQQKDLLGGQKEEAKPVAAEKIEASESDKSEDVPLDLEAVSGVEELEKLGLEVLKAQLGLRGLKVGGTLQQRAERLWQTKGLDPTEYPKHLLVGGGKKRKRS